MSTYDEGEKIRPDFTDSCKLCGQSGLQWSKKKVGWRLVDKSGQIHTCKKAREWTRT